MKKTKRFVALMLAVLMCLALFASCGKSSDNDKKPSQSQNSGGQLDNKDNNGGSTEPDNTEEEQPQYGGIARITKQANPTSLFTIYKTVNGVGYVNECVESLTPIDPVTNEVELRLAESYETDEENYTITYHLQQGVKFHDGSDFNAEVAKWNYDFYIENGQGANIYNPNEVEVVDEYTLRLHFDSWHVDQEQCCGIVSMYSKEAYEKNGLDWCMTHPVGTGAFVFEEYVADNRIVYNRNDNYWRYDEYGNQLPYLDGYIVYIITEANTAMTAFLNGEIDTMLGNTTAIVDTVMNMGYEEKGVDYPGAFTMYWMVPNSNVEGDPWANKEVRKAVMLYGINYEDYFLLASGSYTGRAAFQPYVQDSLLYDEELEAQYVNCYDKEKALEMLTEAGYPDGFKTTIYTIAITANAATALQAALSELNIDASIESISSNDPRRYDGVTPGIYFMNGSTTYDPLKKWIPTNFSSDSKTFGKQINFSSEYDEMLLKAKNAQTWDERAELGKELMKYALVDECYARCMYIQRSSVFIADYFINSGADISRLGGAGAWLKQD